MLSAVRIVMRIKRRSERGSDRVKASAIMNHHSVHMPYGDCTECRYLSIKR